MIFNLIEIKNGKVTRPVRPNVSFFKTQLAAANKSSKASNVRFESLADIPQRNRDVRFTPKSGHPGRILNW